MLRRARHYLSGLQARFRASSAILQPASALDTSSAPHSSSIFSMASKGSKMQALVYKGPGKVALEERPIPDIQHPTDALLKLEATTLCGTDLHVIRGDVPTCTPGRVLGHEGVGEVIKVGAAVDHFRAGDRALIAAVTSCGKCHACRIRRMPSLCEAGGWTLGNTVDGTQAEYCRVPHADGSLHPLPAGGFDGGAACMFSDVYPTSYECGVQAAAVAPGDTVAIVGVGPIGLAALQTAALLSPRATYVLDINDARLQKAVDMGATAAVNSRSSTDAVEEVMQATGRRGVDVALEAVGLPSTFELCQGLLAPGGRIANIGVHGHQAALHLEKLWALNVGVTTCIVDCCTAPMLMQQAALGRLRPGELVTHRFKLADVERAYDVFERSAETGAIKVVVDMA